MPAAQFEHNLLRRLILDGMQLLQHAQAPGLELIDGQMGGVQHVGIYRQSGRQVFGQRGAAVTVWALLTDSLRSTPRLSRSRMNCRLSREPAPRSVISQVKPLSPPRSAGSCTQPAGTRKVNAADLSDILGSATSTKPLENI